MNEADSWRSAGVLVRLKGNVGKQKKMYCMKNVKKKTFDKVERNGL